MANCVYCGRSAGLFRRRHADCRDRRERSIQLIPTFVDRYLSNPIPAARFRELLLAAANQSFISKEELNATVSESLTRFVNTALEDRPITLEEEQRISELLQAHEIANEGVLFERIVKSDILRNIQEGKIPDRVQVVDRLPIELWHGERILWVFNRIESKRNKAADDDGNNSNSTNSRPSADLPYPRRLATKWRLAPKKLLLETTGDLIVTNFNLHLLSSEQAPRRIRFRHIHHLEPYRNALGIISIKDKNDAKLKVGRIITLDDPWFAANLISLLIALSKIEGAPQIDSQSR